MILGIKKGGSDVLRQKAIEVQPDENTYDLINNMWETMYQNKGIGLAANQVGELKRIIVMGVHGQKHALINPVITQRKLGEIRSTEGCLSFPGLRVTVKRSKMVVVEGFDEDWNPVKLKMRGLEAMCVQHEIDHLNGITIR